MDKIILAYSTAPDMGTAKEIARRLVEERLAACVGMMPGMHSVYRWQGVVEEASEVCLVIKTSNTCFAALKERLLSLHPYDVPELVAVPVADGLPAYLQWIRDETA